MTQEEKGRQIVIDETETLFNRKDLDAINSFFTEDFVDHTGTGDKDRSQYSDDCVAIAAAFPDLHVSCDEVIAQGDKVVKRFTATGTQKGPFFGLPASGKPFTMGGMYMYRIRDGRICEQWRVADMLGLMQQVGAIPQPAEAT